MIIKCLPTGMFESNCYIVGDNGEGVIIDAGVKAKYVSKLAESEGFKIKYIVLTHSHIDHICCVDELRERLGAKVAIHESEAAALTDSHLNGSALFGMGRTFKKADLLLKDGDILEAGGLKYEIIHTPGHSAGGISIKVGNNIFTGDTLFKRSIGRTDLPGGNHRNLLDSLKNKLMKFSDEITAYPGHGPKTSLGYERKNNPFVK